jgi:HPt (histidine-containing phosphotransfer) domain-containing protein
MADPESPVLEPAVLDELRQATGADDDFVKELISTYLADGSVLLDAIAKAVEAGDGGALVRPAHTLKSSSASLGAMRLAQLSRDLEEDGRMGRAASAERLAELRSEWSAAAVALGHVVAGNPPR